MEALQTKDTILTAIEESAGTFFNYFTSISDNIFFESHTDKWSIAQHVQHLITSVNMTRLAFRLPRPLLKLYTGKPNRPSRSYDDLVKRYQEKLQKGGRASGRFVPKPISETIGKNLLLQRYIKTTKKLAVSIEKKWKDEQLDRYLAPHPLLGKITLRELCYFTHYHTNHHLETIKGRMKN